MQNRGRRESVLCPRGSDFGLASSKSCVFGGDTDSEFEDCVPLKAVDAFRHPLRWKNGNLESVAGKLIRLEVELRNADLYSLSAAHHFLDAQDKWLLLDDKPLDTRLFDE